MVVLICRAVQGMTAGAGLVVGRAVVRDLHEGPQAQRLMAAITMIFGIAPAIAPVIGGWIHVALGWRSVFGFMVLLGLVLTIAAWVRLPETHPASHRMPFSVRHLTLTAGRIISHRQFLLLAISGGFNFCTMLLFVGAAPAMVLDHWHLSETQFAYLFVPLIIGFTIGAATSGRLAGRIAPDKQVNAGFTALVAGTVFMLALDAAMPQPPLILQQLALVVLATGIQLAFPVLTLRMLDLFPHHRGSAASVQSFVSLLFSGLVIGFVVPTLSHSLVLLATGALTLSLLAIVCWRLVPRQA
jgi:DHA1 family bicyclomycin/chloramphenicol resistance-like MFS transporter